MKFKDVTIGEYTVKGVPQYEDKLKVIKVLDIVTEMVGLMKSGSIPNPMNYLTYIMLKGE